MSFKMQIEKIKNEIYECALSCNRDPKDIKIIAVTKSQPVCLIKEVIENGIDFIAENRVQDAEIKIPELKGLYKEFHFIGHLQTNKINKLLSLCPTLIQSVDSFSTANKLNAAMSSLNKNPNTTLKEKKQIDILIEVNTSFEMTKNGVHPSECSTLIKQIEDLEFVRVKGLMTIGAFTTNEKIVRKCFITLRDLYENERRRSPNTMHYLSMGMSSDYKIAIQEGANMIRLGSLIFNKN